MRWRGLARSRCTDLSITSTGRALRYRLLKPNLRSKSQSPDSSIVRSHLRFGLNFKQRQQFYSFPRRGTRALQHLFQDSFRCPHHVHSKRRDIPRLG